MIKILNWMIRIVYLELLKIIVIKFEIIDKILNYGYQTYTKYSKSNREVRNSNY